MEEMKERKKGTKKYIVPKSMERPTTRVTQILSNTPNCHPLVTRKESRDTTMPKMQREEYNAVTRFRAFGKKERKKGGIEGKYE